MSFSSPESPAFTAFDSSPSPNSSATSLSTEDFMATTPDPAGAIYDYAQQRHDQYERTVSWSPAMKKNPTHPLSVYVPSHHEWVQNVHRANSSSSLANAVDCGPVKQESPDYNVVLSHSQSLPHMPVSQYQRNSPYHSPYHSPYQLPQQNPHSQPTYPSSSTHVELSPIDSPPLLPQYNGNNRSYGSYSSPMGVANSYGVYHHHTNLLDDTRPPFQYGYDMQYKQPADVLVTHDRQQEQVRNPHHVRRPQMINMDNIHADAEATEGNAESEIKTSRPRCTRKASSVSINNAAELKFSRAPTLHYSQSRARESHGQGDSEEEAEVDSDEYEYDDHRNNEYIHRDRFRPSQTQGGNLAPFGAMGGIMGLDGLHNGATVGIAASGRRRSATEPTVTGPYDNFAAPNFAIPDFASGSSSAYDWSLHPGNHSSSSYDRTAPISGINPPGAPLVGIRTHAASSASASRYSPYPTHASARYDEYASNIILSRSRRASYSSESPPLSPNTPLSPMSPSPPSSCYGSISSTATAGDIGSPEPSGTVRRKVRPSNTIPVPIPIPNLTKKSRGRRVPTAALLETSARRNISLGAGELGSASSSSGRGNKARIHLCKVPGCGKCFARGEHLKRHIRSIHTYDKPHRCPYPGCGKDFSRHDNLGQHMRVHKDYRSSP